MGCAVSFIYLLLVPGETWTEAEHAWVFVVKLVVLRVGRFVFKNLSLMMFPSDTLKVSHAYTNMGFMLLNSHYYHTFAGRERGSGSSKRIKTYFNVRLFINNGHSFPG